MLSGIMVELGIYAVARVYWSAFSGAFECSGGRRSAAGPPARWVLLLLGSLTAILGGLMCFLQRHLKRLLAFSSISHMGVLLVGAAILTPAALAGAGIYLVSHGFIKGALFACVGIILNFFTSVDELELRGRGRRFPLTGIIFALGGLALAGMPLFGLYAGKAILDARRRA
jgi:multicomponent Na+:H+ antiporter subunit D